MSDASPRLDDYVLLGRSGLRGRSASPTCRKLFSERNWQIVDALVAVAKEVGRPPAQVALSWVGGTRVSSR